MSRNSRCKRLTALALLLAMCLALFAGCTQKPAPEEPTTAPVKVNNNYLKELKKKGQLVVGVKTDVPELSYYDEETGEWSGLEVELALNIGCEVFGVNRAELGDRVKLVGVTVADREEKLRNGDIDLMLATYTKTKERAKEFALSDSYYTSYIGLMVRYRPEDADSLGTDNIKSLADLDGKVVGVAKNSTTRHDMMEYIATANQLKVTPQFVSYTSYEGLYKALKKGDIDVIAVDVSILNGYNDASTKILKDRFAGQHYGAAVLPENAQLLDAVNKVIGG
ncbi:MAG: transporter substrate-binding domain-containing protein [Clostridia bacterium]|nr:transporter substrate-binding domain-containing protein [Clostridia bacterium]MBP5272287.1 transporter substrate-binding domain-containing protein [Clostridia bacterium]MBP5460001.1 transporter substrate-binding domain-containing protein [Clostridia bacterium]